MTEGDWQTPAERAGYGTTPDYATTMSFVQRLAAEDPGSVRVETFGTTGEGRDLHVVVLSREGLFEPARAHAAGRPVVLIQNCIHAGEPDGKDASLALLRDAVALRRPVVPENVVVLVIPIYNPDGHERTSDHNRINQNGPTPAGWRANGTNLNLNRDYMKADAPETRAFLRLFHRWLPDFFVDNHVTDGADFEYVVTFQVDDTPDVAPGTARWIRETVRPGLVERVEAAGHPTFPAVVFLRDPDDPAQGIAFNDDPPRFSCGQVILENRPALLVEMHMLKEYRSRVAANYELLRALLEIVGRDAERLVQLNRDADAAAGRLGQRDDPPEFPLTIEPSGSRERVVFRGRAFDRFSSDVSGGPAIRYRPEPWTAEIPFDSTVRVGLSVRPPYAYLVPAAWSEVVEVLRAHAVRVRPTTAPWTGVVDGYRLSGMEWPSRPFEGRFPILRSGNVERAFGRFGECTPVTGRRSFPCGSYVVPLDQRLAKVAIHWLEPTAPDSAVRWGFFHSIFEQKESGEGYVLERLAAEALAADPALQAEFRARLERDPEFARRPDRRLDFFFERSPWGAANRVGDYPVARLATLDGVPLGPPE